jgi:hypothetical protein
MDGYGGEEAASVRRCKRAIGPLKLAPPKGRRGGASFNSAYFWLLSAPLLGLTWEFPNSGKCREQGHGGGIWITTPADQ